MRGFKKRSSIENNERPEIVSMSSAQLGRPVFRNFILSKRTLIVILVLLSIVISGYVFYIFYNNKDKSSSEGDSKAITNIAARSGLKTEQLSESSSLTEDQKLKVAKSKVQYWKDQNDCINQDFNTMLLAEKYIELDKKSEAISALEATISDCDDAQNSKSLLNEIKGGG